jgi:hypothetical protein
MYTNTKATVYRLIGGKYERIFLPRVFWDMKSTASTGKNGKTESDTVTVFLPLLLRLTPQKDLIIKDSVPLTIDNSTEEAQSASVKKLFARYDVHTVMACRMCDYGSAEMRHTELDVR